MAAGQQHQIREKDCGMSNTSEVAVEASAAPASTDSGLWVYGVCGLLLLASTINYMDRQTLSGIGPRIKSEFGLTNEQYGHI
ncbi:MAG: hypothetical protein B7Z47_07330, partial [Chthoniobacter sp. 12-60-6]